MAPAAEGSAGSTTVRPLASMFEVFWTVSVAAELSPGRNWVDEGVQVLPTVAAMTSGT